MSFDLQLAARALVTGGTRGRGWNAGARGCPRGRNSDLVSRTAAQTVSIISPPASLPHKGRGRSPRRPFAIMVASTSSST